MATAAWSRSGWELPDAACEAAVAKLGYLPPEDFAALILQNRCSQNGATASWWIWFRPTSHYAADRAGGRSDALSRVWAE
jgi:hypothetical protein